ncbi:hypothetical protein PIB30_109880, partial [Stylosanthes scabra]|nr:hypothetical protein [Stylosanthes scabra]
DSSYFFYGLCPKSYPSPKHSPDSAPTPDLSENSKITSLSSFLLYSDQCYNQMPHALTVFIASAMIYYIILAAPSSLHCRGCTAVRRLCTVVNAPP